MKNNLLRQARYFWKDDILRYSFFGFFIAFFVAFYILVGVYSPLNEKLAQKKAILANLKSDYANFEYLSNNSEAINDSIELLSAYHEKISSRYSSSKFIADISLLFGNNRIDVVSENYSNPKLVGELEVVKVDLVLLCEYESLVAFMTALDSLGQFINISSLNISGNDDRLEVEMTLDIYGAIKNA